MSLVIAAIPTPELADVVVRRHRIARARERVHRVRVRERRGYTSGSRQKLMNCSQANCPADSPARTPPPRRSPNAAIEAGNTPEYNPFESPSTGLGGDTLPAASPTSSSRPSCTALAGLRAPRTPAAPRPATKNRRRTKTANGATCQTSSIQHHGDDLARWTKPLPAPDHQHSWLARDAPLVKGHQTQTFGVRIRKGPTIAVHNAAHITFKLEREPVQARARHRHASVARSHPAARSRANPVARSSGNPIAPSGSSTPDSR